ncbi:porin [Mesorhizobium sp. VNQ89]|uniref:porin n=1 Tax=Mesorhizobium quangtriensis TaxID=3157709 RepID=UPI0032B702BA
MNIKSLLLGSAAALVAVSGARAADAVVIAEPEPMEYVRICDTYGAGFYYIPGTETCLKFSGYMRYDVGIGNRGLLDVYDKEEWTVDEGDDDYNDTYFKRARFQLRVDARQETELGTLRAYAAINFNYDTTTNGYVYDYVTYPGYAFTTSENLMVMEHAYLELGGFRAGVTDSYFSTFTGYSSGVMNDGIVPYGPFQTHQLSYTFTGGNGFTAGIALETGKGGAIDYYGTGQYTYDIYAIDSYMPHVVGGVGYTAGWGGVSGVVGYDSVWEVWSAKGRVDLNVGDALTLFVMGGWADKDDYYYGSPSTLYQPNYYAQWGGDWAVWGGGAWKFNEKATFNFEIGYDDAENFSAVANVAYELVPGFTVTPEVIYTDNFDTDPDDNWGGYFRLQYNWGS